MPKIKQPKATYESLNETQKKAHDSLLKNWGEATAENYLVIVQSARYTKEASQNQEA